jgi:hypothetical protein
MFKKIFIFIGILLLLIILLIILIYLTNPLFKSEETLQNDILKLTPLGTSIDEVIKIIKTRKKWRITQISNDHGYIYQKSYPLKEIGNKSIRAEIGEYGFILVTNVTIFWGFDENSKLIDVWVWKTTDGP